MPRRARGPIGCQVGCFAVSSVGFLSGSRGHRADQDASTTGLRRGSCGREYRRSLRIRHRHAAVTSTRGAADAMNSPKPTRSSGWRRTTEHVIRSRRRRQRSDRQMARLRVRPAGPGTPPPAAESPSDRCRPRGRTHRRGVARGHRSARSALSQGPRSDVTFDPAVMSHAQDTLRRSCSAVVGQLSDDERSEQHAGASARHPDLNARLVDEQFHRSPSRRVGRSWLGRSPVNGVAVSPGWYPVSFSNDPQARSFARRRDRRGSSCRPVHDTRSDHPESHPDTSRSPRRVASSQRFLP